MPRKSVRCYVQGCTFSCTIDGIERIPMFCFPRSRDSCQKWIEFCRNPTINKKAEDRSLYNSTYMRICSRHFTEESFCNSLKKKLLRGAIPTIAASQSLDNEYKNEATSESPRLSEQEDHSVEVSDHESAPESYEKCSTISPPSIVKFINKYGPDPCHMIEELPEVYMHITLPHLEQAQLNLQWVYNIISGEEGQERVVYECPCKDDKTGFVLIKDSRWDGVSLENLHLLALPYRPGLLSLRDLREDHLPLLKNIYIKGKSVIMEKYGVIGSQLRIFLQYQPSFYHLNVHFTTMNDEICESHFGKAHPLYSVINNIQICPTYYQVSSLPFYLKESDDLFPKFEAYGLVTRIGQPV